MAAFVCLALPAAAAAHVQLAPDRVAPGSFTLFTVLSPNESGQPLTGLRLAIPPGLEIDAVADTPGFTANVVEDRRHRVAALNWQGGSVPPDRLALFHFSGTPSATGTLLLTGIQRFADGSTRTWRTAELTVADDPAAEDTVARALGIAALVLGVLVALAVGYVIVRGRRAAG